jgi:hypothetical protein
LRHVIAADKPTIGWWAVTTAWTGTFGFFRCASTSPPVRSAVDRTAIEDHAVNVTLMQPAIELLFRFAFGEKLRMPNLNAVGKFPGQASRNCQIARAERGRQLQPVLADARCQRRQAGKNSWLSRRSCAARPGAKWWPET